MSMVSVIDLFFPLNFIYPTSMTSFPIALVTIIIDYSEISIFRSNILSKL